MDTSPSFFDPPSPQNNTPLQINSSPTPTPTLTPTLPFEEPLPGLSYVPNFLDAQEEKSLLEFIYQQKWNKEITRRTQHYGCRYIYKTRSLGKAPPVPPIFEKLARKIKSHKFTTLDFDQVIVNEYIPGQGIAPHVDHPSHFGSDIVTISLKSALNMDFSGPKIKTQSVRLEPRSMVVLKKYARNVVRHGIAQVKEDNVPGVGKVPRKTRVSITFRKIINKTIFFKKSNLSSSGQQSMLAFIKK